MHTTYYILHTTYYILYTPLLTFSPLTFLLTYCDKQKKVLTTFL